jgi:hypothetical protein
MESQKESETDRGARKINGAGRQSTGTFVVVVVVVDVVVVIDLGHEEEIFCQLETCAFDRRLLVNHVLALSPFVFVLLEFRDFCEL